MPSRVLLTIASFEETTMAASRASAASLSRCWVTSTNRFTVPVSSPFRPCRGMG